MAARGLGDVYKEQVFLSPAGPTSLEKRITPPPLGDPKLKISFTQGGGGFIRGTPGFAKIGNSAGKTVGKNSLGRCAPENLSLIHL